MHQIEAVRGRRRDAAGVRWRRMMTLPMAQPQTVTIGSLPPGWQRLATRADVATLRIRPGCMATNANLAALRGEFHDLRAGLVGLPDSLSKAGWFPGLVVGLIAAPLQIGLFLLPGSLGCGAFFQLS